MIKERSIQVLVVKSVFFVNEVAEVATLVPFFPIKLLPRKVLVVWNHDKVVCCFQAKLEAAKQKFGREIRVFETSTDSSTSNDVSRSGISLIITNCYLEYLLYIMLNYLIHFDWQRSQMTSMSSLQKIIIESCLPKRKVVYTVTII